MAEIPRTAEWGTFTFEVKLFKGWIYLNINFPPVAWETYRGRLLSTKVKESLGLPPLTFWGASLLKELNSIETKNEFLLEDIRKNEYPDKVSRLSGIFYFRTEEEATQGQQLGLKHTEKEFLSEIDFDGQPRNSIHDANWISSYRWENSNPDWMRKYWQGIPCDKGHSPIWEGITESSGIVGNTKLREKAYVLIKARYPSSLLLLDLSRIASEGAFPLGHVTPFATSDQSNVILTFIIRMVELKDPNFLEFLKSYIGPKRDFSEVLVTPDFRDLNFVITPHGPR